MPSAIARRWQAADLLARTSPSKRFPSITPCRQCARRAVKRPRAGADRVRRAGPERLRTRSQPPRRQRHQRALTVLHFGHCGSRGLFSRHDVRTLDDAPALSAGRRRTRGVVGRERLGQHLPGPAGRVAGAGLQRVRVDTGLQGVTTHCLRGRAKRSRRTARTGDVDARSKPRVSRDPM